MTRHVEGERLSAWIAGELSDRDTAVVRAHVEGCADCSRASASLREQVVAMRLLDRPEPPATLWPAIEGVLERSERNWSWRSGLTGALAGAAAVALAAWGVANAPSVVAVRQRRQIQTVDAVQNEQTVQGADERAGERGNAPARAGDRNTPAGIAEPAAVDPLLVEAEREFARAASSYEQAVNRLRKILDREQAAWDPGTRARIGDRLARLEEAVAHSRAVVRRDPGDATGADMLFSAYRRQIDFLAEVVHRGSPAVGEGLR